MKRGKKLEFDKTNIAYGITALVVICLSILFYLVLTKMTEIKGAFNSIISIMMPIIIGCIIAYLLLPLYNGIYKRTEKWLLKFLSEKPAVLLAKTISVFLSLLLLLAVIVVLLLMAVPQVIDSIFALVESMPATGDKISNFAQNLLKDNPEISKLVVDLLNNLETNLLSLFSEYVLPSAQKMLSGITTGITAGIFNVLNFLLNVAIGIIVCVYLLVNKDTFCAQSKKALYAFFKRERANHIIEDTRQIHRIFSGFISGKIVDSFIIGVITFVALSIMNVPYTVMISTIVGVTNIIPFFGPFIGAIPSAFIILMLDPWKCLYFLIYIIVIQQIDGNIIGPKILGNSIGLPSFWVLFAIILGGGLFGFAGMILGVPVFASIYLFVSRAIDNSLSNRGLSTGTAPYYNLHNIDEEDGVLHMNYWPDDGEQKSAQPKENLETSKQQETQAAQIDSKEQEDVNSDE